MLGNSRISFLPKDNGSTPPMTDEEYIILIKKFTTLLLSVERKCTLGFQEVLFWNVKYTSYPEPIFDIEVEVCVEVGLPNVFADIMGVHGFMNVPTKCRKPRSLQLQITLEGFKTSKGFIAIKLLSEAMAKHLTGGSFDER